HSESSNNNLLDAGVDFFESMGRAALIKPVQSVQQLIDEVQGKPLHLEAPASKNQGGLDGFASKAGDAIGTALPFVASALLLHKFVPITAESRLLGIGSGFALGAGYSGLFSPVYGETKNFWQAKLENAAVSGLTVGTMSAFGAPAASDSAIANIANRAYTGFKAGAAGGLVNAEFSSLFNGQPIASPQKLLDNGLAYGITGAALGGLGGVMSKSDAANESNDEITSPEKRVNGTSAEPAPKLGYSLAADARTEADLPMIGRDDDAGLIAIIDGDRSATFRNGQWTPGVTMSGARFAGLSDVRDPNEIQLLMQAAEQALNKSVEK
ncbi:MAG TPA: hypothetical protein V6C72_13650, partial [Chroococcales cyanobacterium]